MRIIVRAADIAQPALRDQVPANNAGRTDDLLAGIASEIVRVRPGIEIDAVDGDFLADIAGNYARIIAVFPEVVV